eukprot:6802287-Prymnesium_polylepis.1
MTRLSRRPDRPEGLRRANDRRRVLEPAHRVVFLVLCTGCGFKRIVVVVEELTATARVGWATDRRRLLIGYFDNRVIWGLPANGGA